jgi:hypothetical protein
MNRRTWLKWTGASAASITFTSATALFTGGCAFSLSTILEYIPVGVNAIKGVFSVLSAAGITVPGLDIILAAFAALSGGISEWQNAPAAQKATLLDKVSLLLHDVIDQIGTVLSAITLGTSPLLTLVTGLITVILNILGGFATHLPPPPAVGRLTHIPMVAHHPLTIVPKVVSIKTFKAQYNAIAVAGGHNEIELW